MRYILSPIGSAGDVHPMLGLALELQSRGHDVTFLASGYFRETVQRSGLEFVELGSHEQFVASMQAPDLWDPMRAFQHIYRSIVQPNLETQYRLFTETSQVEGTVGIANCFGFGARIAQDKSGLPLATLHIQPAVIWSDIEPPRVPSSFGPRWLKRLLYRIGERFVIDRVVCPDVNALRQKLGLSPMHRTTHWWHSPELVVCTFPGWFATPQADWPTNLVQTDFPLWDEQSHWRSDPDLDGFLAGGEPPVAFTPGSANIFGKSFFEAAVAACQVMGTRGILLSRFADHIPPTLPPNIRHFAFVPLSSLLPRCAAIVHHGGIGTTSQAFAAGIPQLIMPLAHDEFDNAARVKRLGAGDWLPKSQFRTEAVAAKIGELLSDAEVRLACQRIAERLATRSGIATTADAVERLAANRGRRLRPA